MLRNQQFQVLFSNNQQSIIVQPRHQMFQQTSQKLDSWKNQMKQYEKQKRTKKPFGKEVPYTEHVTHKDIKQRQSFFNPVLQTFKNPNDEIRKNEQDDYTRAKSLMNHLRQTRKHEKPYDIVNLHSAQNDLPSVQQPNGKKLGPLRNAYNVINNTKLPDYYFRNREVKLPVEREKNLIQNNPKQYNIVTGVYYENHDQRMKSQQQLQKATTFNKYWKTHDYDPVFGKFYDTQKQKMFQEQRKKEEKDHGKDFQSRLPPSYHLPQSLQTIDEKRFNAKKRYQLKYFIQDEYNKRNVEQEQKQDKIVKNRVHNGRIEEHKAKQFDIITMKQYQPDRAEQLFNKKNAQSTWQRLQNDSNKIKTGGFN